MFSRPAFSRSLAAGTSRGGAACLAVLAGFAGLGHLVRSTLMRAWYLSFASTIVHGAFAVDVRPTMSQTASLYASPSCGSASLPR